MTEPEGVRPAAPAAAVAASTMERLVFDVQNMTCASCARRVERVLSRQPGVDEAVVNFATGQAVVSVAAPAAPGSLIEAVSRIGYGLTPHVAEVDPAEAARTTGRRFLVSAVLTAPLVLLHFIPAVEAWLGAASGWVALVLSAPVQFWGGWPFIRSAVLKARHVQANMDTLVAVGSLTAWLWSAWVVVAARGAGHGAGAHAGDVYFETAAVIVTLILLGRYFEARAVTGTSAAIRMLLELGAKEAHVLRGAREFLMLIEHVRVGDLVKVYPGEKIPTDGVLVEAPLHVALEIRPVGIGEHVLDPRWAAGAGRGRVRDVVARHGYPSRILAENRIEGVPDALELERSGQRVRDRLTHYVTSRAQPGIGGRAVAAHHTGRVIGEVRRNPSHVLAEHEVRQDHRRRANDAPENRRLQRRHPIAGDRRYVRQRKLERHCPRGGKRRPRTAEGGEMLKAARRTAKRR